MNIIILFYDFLDVILIEENFVIMLYMLFIIGDIEIIFFIVFVNFLVVILGKFFISFCNKLIVLLICFVGIEIEKDFEFYKIFNYFKFCVG